jgi:tight adherence protein C
MSLIPFLLLFLVLAGAIAAFGYVRFAKPSNLLDRLTSSTSTPTSADPEMQLLEDEPSAGFAGILEFIGRLLPYSPKDVGVMKNELGAAGFRADYAAYAFLGIRVLSSIVLLVTATLIRHSLTSNSLNLILIPVGGGVGGFLLPGLILGRLVKARRQAIRLALPDVLDLLVISTEAGCALDKAMLNVSREFKTFHPVISEELALVNMEMLAGGSRMEALRNFATRTGEDDLKKLVAILIQTDRFGTSVAEALRTQSDFMRVRRRQIAEERAAKVGVKLVFPIFFFCMPSLMLIVAGPGMLQLFNNLLPAMAGLK